MSENPPLPQTTTTSPTLHSDGNRILLLIPVQEHNQARKANAGQETRLEHCNVQRLTIGYASIAAHVASASAAIPLRTLWTRTSGALIRSILAKTATRSRRAPSPNNDDPGKAGALTTGALAPWLAGQLEPMAFFHSTALHCQSSQHRFGFPVLFWNCLYAFAPGHCIALRASPRVALHFAPAAKTAGRHRGVPLHGKRVTALLCAFQSVHQLYLRLTGNSLCIRSSAQQKSFDMASFSCLTPLQFLSMANAFIVPCILLHSKKQWRVALTRLKCLCLKTTTTLTCLDQQTLLVQAELVSLSSLSMTFGSFRRRFCLP